MSKYKVKLNDTDWIDCRTTRIFGKPVIMCHTIKCYNNEINCDDCRFRSNTIVGSVILPVEKGLEEGIVVKQSTFEKVRIKVREVISKLFNHTHGCCDNIFKNCNKCKGVE